VDSKRRDIIVAAACAAVLVAANVVLFATGRLPERLGGVPDWISTLGLLAAVAITFAMYSMLYKDNPFFRAAENLFVGLGLGVSFWAMWYLFFKPDVYDRLVVPAFDPTAHVLRSDLVLIIPLFLGALVLVRVSPKHGWISRYPIAFLVGYWSGYSIQPTFHSLILKQVEKTMVPVQMHWIAWALCCAAALAIIAAAYRAAKGGKMGLALKIASGLAVVSYVILRNTPAATRDPLAVQAFRGVDTLLIVLGVVAVLCYFFFSAEHKGTLGAVSRVGVIFLMISFGASFGYTVMARESLIIGQVQFLLGEWLGLM